MTVKEAILQLKTDLINWVTVNLRTKVDKEALNSALDVKADLEYTDSELAKKSDTSHSHSTFVLHIDAREDISKEPDLSSAEYATSYRHSSDEKPVVDFRTNWASEDIVYLTIGHKYTDATNGADSKTFKSVTVDKCGHVIAGSNPTTLAEYGLSDDAYTKSEVDAKIAELNGGGSIDLDGYVTEEELSNNYYTQTEVEDYVATVNSRNAGKRVQSVLYMIDGVSMPAQDGAEVFNTPNNSSVHNIAIGTFSHAEGDETIALGAQQHVQGAYNIADTTSLHIVGNGTDPSERSNAHTIDWEGNAWFAGDVYVSSTSGTNRDTGSKKLVAEDEVYTKGEVDAKLAEIQINGGTGGSVDLSGFVTEERLQAALENESTGVVRYIDSRLAPLEQLKECLSDEYDTEFAIADSCGFVIARINENGLDTTSVVTDHLVVAGEIFNAITDEEIIAMFEEDDELIEILSEE